jgi:Cu(I)/Ag(I) efflux system membrane fusion protein
MNGKKLTGMLVVIGLVAAGGYGAYRLGMKDGMRMSAAAADTAGSPEKPGNVDPATGKKVLYWHDPMVPGQKFDKPGKSPFMDMQLVPVYADSGGSEGGVTINPRVQQNLGVRTAEVTKGTMKPTVEAVGSVAYNERDVAVVQARANGFVEKLIVRAPLDPVRPGQALAELYVPDWVAAQEDYLTAKRIAGSAAGANLTGLADSARQRMRLAGMNEEQIARVESSGKVQARITLTAPTGGVVTELAAREGMTVMAGAPLFRISGLSTVWVNAEVPEAQAGLVRPGNLVEARSAAIPEKTFKGKVSALLPEVNPTTRTVKARIEIANPGAQLVPGMFVSVNFTPASAKETLFVPSEALIQTGKRNVIIVAQGDGRFTPVDVEVGRDENGQTEIRKGLDAGQKVVVSGQFLVDSEASLKASTARMGEAPTATPAASATHRAEGKVEDIGKDEITISHGPVPTLQWGPMTMAFKLPAAGLPKGLHAGDPVAFEFRQSKEGPFEITSIAPARAGPPPAGASAAKGAISEPRESVQPRSKP